MALLASRAASAKNTQPGACEDLEQFVGVIRNDRTKPKIPAKLATAWSQSAQEIEASLGCKRPVPARGRHRGHRSGRRR
jgi:hypothetical protein